MLHLPRQTISGLLVNTTVKLGDHLIFKRQLPNTLVGVNNLAYQRPSKSTSVAQRARFLVEEVNPSEDSEMGLDRVSISSSDGEFLPPNQEHLKVIEGLGSNRQDQKASATADSGAGSERDQDPLLPKATSITTIQLCLHCPLGAL